MVENVKSVKINHTLLNASPAYAPSIFYNSCYLDVLTNPALTPLIVGSEVFPEPSLNGSLHFVYREPIYIACPGGEFTPTAIDVNGHSVYCREGTIVDIKTGVAGDFNKITCTLNDTARPYLTDKPNSDISCEGGTAIEIGYTLNKSFYRALLVCFQLELGIPLYTKYRISKWAKSGQNYLEPPRYVFDLGLFSDDPVAAYENYATAFEGLGLQRYVDGVHYLTKGQLAAYDEFLYSFQRDATYDLANVAPRWNTFDQGNWRVLENAVVNLLESGDIGDATVLTGTLKVATLVNVNGTEEELRLKESGTTFPVPRWFWKLVYIPGDNIGAVFFGYNNPYVSKDNVDSEFLGEICYSDVFEILQDTWLLNGVDNSDSFLVYIYACQLDTNQIIDTLLAVIVRNVLLEWNLTMSFS
ncbi:uncharacterized protein LOC135130583 [Zophobas morio]|uniref:uncharacterized protein LOC135130583 n=1 Tax=Zophobas morio TaxID=2755281 RepID=UPI0030838F3B